MKLVRETERAVIKRRISKLSCVLLVLAAVPYIGRERERVIWSAGHPKFWSLDPKPIGEVGPTLDDGLY